MLFIYLKKAAHIIWGCVGIMLKEKLIPEIFFRHWWWLSSAPKKVTDLRIMKGSLQSGGLLL